MGIPLKIPNAMIAAVPKNWAQSKNATDIGRTSAVFTLSPIFDGRNRAIGA
jgi:hypothetical protein